MFSKKTLVLLSGGQDSSTCLFWAINKFGKENISSISFDYGQRHQVETAYAERLAKKHEIPWELVPLGWSTVSGLFGNSSLDVSSEHPIAAGLPSSFVPGRNALFLLTAGIKAFEKGMTNLVVGVSSVDYSGYPDCRPQFIRSMQAALSDALDFSIIIHTPLIYKTKKETWQMAKDLGVLEEILENTLTCYNGNETQNSWGKGCGMCPSCVLRRKGWEEFSLSI